MYTTLRNLFFKFPPEQAHHMAMQNLRLLTRLPYGKKLVSSFAAPSRTDLATRLFHLQFKNPVGLGAGFDKNAQYLTELEALGFGFVEIGTVTPKAQPGNEKPRLFRLPQDKALINRMGFNNDGAEAIAKRLEQWREKNKSSRLVIGGNIGKNKITPNEEAWKDYVSCFNTLHHVVDYFVVNVSSPNTPGLRALQQKDSLRRILMHLLMINNGKAVAKPVLLKIAPDLEQPELDAVLELAMEIQLDGIVATNTTIERRGLRTPIKEVTEMGDGGLSGKPLKEQSTAIVKYISEQTNGKLPIIASGGIFNARDVKEKMEAGASLVQIWTGFIYEGPAIVNKICKNL